MSADHRDVYSRVTLAAHLTFTEAAHFTFNEAVHDLIEVTVWPPDADPIDLAAVVARAARPLVFRPEGVRQAASSVVEAAKNFAAVVADIRATSKPGLGDAVDVRRAGDYDTVWGTLTSTYDRYLQAAQIDLGTF